MGNCGASCGIQAERARQLLGARRAARCAADRAPSGIQRSPRAVSYDRLTQLATRLEASLPVRAILEAGERDACDSIFLLAGLQRPCLRELQDGDTPRGGASAATETYLRVAISAHGPFAVVVEEISSWEPTEAGIVVVHEPRPGVVDGRLRHIVRGLQGVLRKARIVVLDLVVVLQPIDGDANLWSDLFDEDTSPLAVRAVNVGRA